MSDMEHDFKYDTPDGYMPRQLWEDYCFHDTLPYVSFHAYGEKIVSNNGIEGVSVGIPIFKTALFSSHIEPDHPYVSSGTPLLSLWYRFGKEDSYQNWYKKDTAPRGTNGYCEIRDGVPYYHEWTHNTAHLYRNHWYRLLTNNTYRIEDTDLPTFLSGYDKSSTARRVGWFERRAVHQKLSFHFASIRYRVVRRTSDHSIVAGMATSYSPRYKNSYYEVGYMDDAFARDRVMIGLMDDWFSYSEKNGFRFLQMGNFWQPGNPDNWKGFSQFKMQFGTRVVHLPPILFRKETNNPFLKLFL